MPDFLHYIDIGRDPDADRPEFPDLGAESDFFDLPTFSEVENERFAAGEAAQEELFELDRLDSDQY
jgi:hypothetical protein